MTQVSHPSAEHQVHKSDEIRPLGMGNRPHGNRSRAVGVSPENAANPGIIA